MTAVLKCVRIRIHCTKNTNVGSHPYKTGKIKKTRTKTKRKWQDSLARAQLIDGGDHLIVQLLIKLSLLGFIPAGDIREVKHWTWKHSHTHNEEEKGVYRQQGLCRGHGRCHGGYFRPSCQCEREYEVVCTHTRVGVACRMPCVSLNPWETPDTASEGKGRGESHFLTRPHTYPCAHTHTPTHLI